MSACWINTISREHVLIGVEGGFTQAGHGSDRVLKRLSLGDRIVFYSPKQRIDGADPVQAFTALGRVADETCYRVAVTPDFNPWRRRVVFDPSAKEAPIRPMLEQLSFIPDAARWGFPFRRGLFEISGTDFRLIVDAMGVHDA